MVLVLPVRGPKPWRSMLVRTLLATAATILLVPPTNVQAQLRFEIAPALGHYTPSPSQLPLGVHTLPCYSDGNGGCRSFFANQNGAVALGGRVTGWFNRRGAIEGAFWYSPSGVTGFIDGAYTSAGSVVLASMRLVTRLGLGSQAPAASILLMGGPTVTQRSGGYYGNLSGRTSFGGVVGVGFDVRPGRHFGFRAQADDYVYNTNFAPSPPSQRQLHHDIVLSLSPSLR
jgi:hypothetical protein